MPPSSQTSQPSPGCGCAYEVPGSIWGCDNQAVKDTGSMPCPSACDFMAEFCRLEVISLTNHGLVPQYRVLLPLWCSGWAFSFVIESGERGKSYLLSEWLPWLCSTSCDGAVSFWLSPLSLLTWNKYPWKQTKQGNIENICHQAELCLNWRFSQGTYPKEHIPRNISQGTYFLKEHIHASLEQSMLCLALSVDFSFWILVG